VHRVRDTELNRDPHRRAQPAELAVTERDVAAMRARDVARNRQPKSGAALVLIARIIKPQERLEHILAPAGMPGPSSSTLMISQR